MIFIHGGSNGQYDLSLNSKTSVNEYIHSRIRYKSKTKLVINISCYGGVNKKSCSSGMLSDKVSGVVFSSDNTIAGYKLSPYLVERKWKYNWTYHRYYNKKVRKTSLELRKILTFNAIINDAKERWDLAI